MSRSVHHLLQLARAAAGGPVPQGTYRHRSHALGSTDPVVWVHVITHQGEPFTFGALVVGTVDPATGGITDMRAFIPDHPLDTKATTETFNGFASWLTAHLDGPFKSRTDPDGRHVDVEDHTTSPGSLPRIVVTGPQTMQALAQLGQPFSREGHPAAVQHAGRWLRELEAMYRFAGQSVIVDVTSQLTDAFVVPLSAQEQTHLAATVAAITGGPSAAWKAEQLTLGPVLDLSTADAQWGRHTQLRRARKDGRGRDAARLRAHLERVYWQVALQAAQTTTAGLRLLDRVQEEPRFAGKRRHEDMRRYLKAASFLHGKHQGRRGQVGTISQNARGMQERETAVALAKLRQLATDQLQRCQRWPLGEIVEGTRTDVRTERTPTGRFTPTGRQEQVTMVDIDIDLPDQVCPPAVGSDLLWAGDDSFQTEGTVTAIDERTVTIRVVGTGTRKVKTFELPACDVWLTGRPPFTGSTTIIPKAELPLTHTGGPTR